MSKTAQEIQELLTVQEAADFLHVSPGTIRRWAYQAQLKGKKIGPRGDWRFTKDDLEMLAKPNSVVVHETEASHTSQGEHRNHSVQFYDDDAYLIHSVKSFIQPSEVAIVIATPEHRILIEKGLGRQEGAYISLDAEETLGKFMVNGSPDPSLFQQVVGSVIRESADGNRKVRAFGEMVAILWQKGNPTAAIRLEELWNNLLSEYKFQLFCAYPMSSFVGQSHMSGFMHVCDTHGVITPSESYASLGSEDARLREIAVLQQKATSLEAEMQRNKEIEKLLQEQNSTLEDFFENSAVGIHWIGPDETILRANRAELEMLGYSAEEYVGRNIREFHVDPNVIEDILACLKNGEVLKDYESQLRCKDGSIKDVLIDSSVFWKDGSFVHTRCFTRDVSDRKRYERALRESEEHFRALVNATSDVIYRMSPDWSEMRQLDGRNFLADTGESDRGWLNKYIHPDDQAHVLETIHRAIEKKAVFQLEHQVLQADGTLGWTFSRAIPILNSEGEILEWFGAASNITARKRQEAILREEDKRKDDFLAILAHELRNPLSPIASATDMLQLEGSQTEYGKEAVTVIQRQVQHMVRLIDDLLDISRIKRGKFELKQEPVDLREVIRAAIETSQAAIENSGHRLVTSFAPQKLQVNGDDIRLAQAVSNLLSNAARYTPPGGTIWLETEEKDGAVVIMVRDTGIGIDDKTLPRVFDMFVQGKQASGVNRGLGIGLTLVKRLVEMHGGTIEAKSPGKDSGSTFTIRLPLAAQTEVNLGRFSANKPSTVSTQRILVVDDNKDALAMLAATLRMQGNEIAIAADGLEAVKATQEFLPDVILMDIGMPNMNGYEAARLIRAKVTDRPLKIIAVTGWGQKADKVRAREAGFDAHITKPVDSKILAQLLS